MLRLNEDGSISLTINNLVIGELDSLAADEITARELVRWENIVRLQHYERNFGFWCMKNQREVREVQLENAKQFSEYELTPIDDFNEYWDLKREEAVDN